MERRSEVGMKIRKQKAPTETHLDRGVFKKEDVPL
jgi:hypothetical protein